MDGSSGVPDEEDDDGRDDEDQQEDGDTERLLLVGGLQFALDRLSGTVKIDNFILLTWRTDTNLFLKPIRTCLSFSV